MLTLGEVAQALRTLGDAPLPQVTEAMAQASIRGARGNSGMMLSQFLLGLRDGLGDQPTATARDLARAIRMGFERLNGALDDPVEGTILTVARDAADEAAAAADERDLKVFMRRLVTRAERSLQRTPELLAALKAAGVVDAGAKGFVRLLDGVKRLIEEGGQAQGAIDRDLVNAAATTEVASDRDFRFCTEVMVRGTALPKPEQVRASLRALGGSIVVLESGDLLKAHVHTDTPDAVFALGRGWGALEYTKAEDMRAQHQALATKRPVAFVADTACDLPDSAVFEQQIGLVPLQVVVGDRVYRDRLELSAAEFVTKLRHGQDATTSQPTRQAFAEVYRDALRVAEKIVVVTVSKPLSGTYANAEAAAKEVAADRIFLVDSRSASLGEGLLVLRGLELAAQGIPAEAIAVELARVRTQSSGFFIVDNLERLIRSEPGVATGRVAREAAECEAHHDADARRRGGSGRSRPRTRGGADQGPGAPGSGARREAGLAPAGRGARGAFRSLRRPFVRNWSAATPPKRRSSAPSRRRPRRPHRHRHTWGVFYQVEDGTNAGGGRYMSSGRGGVPAGNRPPPWKGSGPSWRVCRIARPFRWWCWTCGDCRKRRTIS